jgi:hypothetical protein
MNTNTTESNTVHPFEAAGLGKAPFRFVGMEAQDLCYGERILNRKEYQKTGVSVTTQPGGSCAYCGTYIRNMYNIESSDGKRFHVGCECVNKTEDKSLIKKVKEATKVLNAKKRFAKANEAKDNLTSMLANADTRKALQALPHPNGYAGKSLLGYADWMAENAGNAGRVRTLNLIKKALG